jgi:hypothetical protein
LFERAAGCFAIATDARARNPDSPSDGTRMVGMLLLEPVARAGAGWGGRRSRRSRRGRPAGAHGAGARRSWPHHAPGVRLLEAAG